LRNSDLFIELCDLTGVSQYLLVVESMGKKAWSAALTATLMLLVCGGPALAQCVTISPYGGGGKGARGGGLPTSVGGSPPGYHVSPRGGQAESVKPSATAVHKPAKGFEVDGPPKLVKFKDGSTALVSRPNRPGRLDAPFYNTPSKTSVFPSNGR